MSFFYYETLANIGSASQIMDDIRRNFGNMITHGATTCWEEYPSLDENRANPDMLTRSHCHACSSAPAYFIGREILGVKSLAPGWTEVAIAPQNVIYYGQRVAYLTRLAVATSADETNKTIKIRVTYLQGVQVSVCLPDADGYKGEVTEIILARSE